MALGAHAQHGEALFEVGFRDVAGDHDHEASGVCPWARRQIIRLLLRAEQEPQIVLGRLFDLLRLYKR